MTWKHGTRYGYFKKGCRCDRCVEGRKREDRERRARRRSKAAADPSQVPHGSPFATRDWGCHCEACVLAARTYYRKKGQTPRREFTDAEKAAAVALYRTSGTKAAAESAGVCPETINEWRKAAGATYKRPERHTRGGAYRRGCRCDDCMASFRADMEKRKGYLAARAAKGEVPHGTWNGYGNYGCRCDACRAANSEHNRLPEVRAYHREWARKRRVA